MGIKTNNTIFNSIKFGTLESGISFKIPSNRTLSTLYPAFADSTSTGVSKFSFNMGQDPFVGDSRGYLPYDNNYSHSNLVGNYTTEGTNNEVIVPGNLSTVIYNVQRSSGKYYFEINLEDDGRYGAVGLAPSAGDNFRIKNHGVGLSGIGFAREYLTYSSDVRVTEKGSYSSTDDREYQFTNYNVATGDILQVFVDYDNNNITIKKVGTDITDHKNYQIV